MEQPNTQAKPIPKDYKRRILLKITAIYIVWFILSYGFNLGFSFDTASIVIIALAIFGYILHISTVQAAMKEDVRNLCRRIDFMCKKLEK